MFCFFSFFPTFPTYYLRGFAFSPSTMNYALALTPFLILYEKNQLGDQVLLQAGTPGISGATCIFISFRLSRVLTQALMCCGRTSPVTWFVLLLGPVHVSSQRKGCRRHHRALGSGGSPLGRDPTIYAASHLYQL